VTTQQIESEDYFRVADDTSTGSGIARYSSSPKASRNWRLHFQLDASLTFPP